MVATKSSNKVSSKKSRDNRLCWAQYQFSQFDRLKYFNKILMKRLNLNSSHYGSERSVLKSGLSSNAENVRRLMSPHVDKSTMEYFYAAMRSINGYKYVKTTGSHPAI